MKFSARKLFYSIPPAWRFAVRRLYYLPVDTWETVTGQRDSLTPPKGIIYTGGGDFKVQGERALSHFIEFCGLQPHHQVLDVGSGIGRMAVPLTRYLNETGSYDGFDVVEKGVEWCREHIAVRFPNFKFQYIPIDNDLYRTDGKNAANFQFPFDGNRFDFVIVNSVFTHMVLEEVDNYLEEISRVLKPGGCCYATFFLFDQKMAWPEGFDFPFDHGEYRLMDEEVKSANVAFDENYLLRDLAEKKRLSVRHLFYGSWRGLPRQDCKEFQDIVIFQK